jgi:MoxR-like ATPase
VRGRTYVTPDDIVDVAVDVLAHRTIIEVDQVLEGVTGARVVAEVLKAHAPPRQTLPAVR